MTVRAFMERHERCANCACILADHDQCGCDAWAWRTSGYDDWSLGERFEDEQAMERIATEEETKR